VVSEEKKEKNIGEWDLKKKKKPTHRERMRGERKKQITRKT
jgi:hypothetical protein